MLQSETFLHAVLTSSFWNRGNVCGRFNRYTINSAKTLRKRIMHANKINNENIVRESNLNFEVSSRYKQL